MDKLESNIRAERVRTVLNNFALEGYKPDKVYQALIDRYVKCELSYEEFLQSALDLFRNHAKNVHEYNRQLDRFEAAQELLNSIGSIYFGKIFREKKKLHPDIEAIEKWQDELQNIHAVYRSLSFFDMKNVEDVISSFAKVYKSLQEKS